MKLKEIITCLEKWAPASLIDDWDNSGLQIGSEEKNIKRILLALDLDKHTLKKAVSGKYDLVITHHPIIFKPLKSILSSRPDESIIIDLIKNDIAAYNAHSNLDLAVGGVSDKLAESLLIRNTNILKEVGNSSAEKETTRYGYGRIGEIEPIRLKSFIRDIKKALNIDSLILYEDSLDKNIKKVAVCGGSGGDFIKDAYELGADVYITGDIKYHEAQYAYERGLSLIDVGHFHSEKLILPAIKGYLQNKLDLRDIDIIMDQNLPQIIL